MPQMDFEIAHINISYNNEEESAAEQLALREKALRDADEGVASCPWEDDAPVVDWHTDSYPFVCVLMLSDCTNMIGGETALRTGSGKIMKVRGPTMVRQINVSGKHVLTLQRAMQWSFKVATLNIKH